MRRLALALAVGGLTSLAACTHSQPEPADGGPREDAKPEPAKPEPESPPAPEPPPADAVTKELTLVPSELTIRDDGVTMVHCLDCERQAATFNYCEFDKAAFVAAVGTPPPDQKLKLRVQMVPKTSHNRVPDDPNLPQPEGGFTDRYNTCTVEAVLPLE